MNDEPACGRHTSHVAQRVGRRDVAMSRRVPAARPASQTNQSPLAEGAWGHKR